MNMANCSSHHLPFTLRYRVESYSPPSGEGEARGKGGGRGNDYSRLSCQNKHVISPCGKVKCRWTPSISGGCSQRPTHTALPGLGRTPSGCPSDFKCERVKGRFHPCSFSQGGVPHPGSNLCKEKNSATRLCTASPAEPCWVLFFMVQVFGRLSWGPKLCRGL